MNKANGRNILFLFITISAMCAFPLAMLIYAITKQFDMSYKVWGCSSWLVVTMFLTVLFSAVYSGGKSRREMEGKE
jgi:uncharacterized BrkB/YihY/UPF0761 family membrane protein